MIEWLAGLDPRTLMIAIGVIGVLLAFPFVLASIRRLRRLQLVRGTLFFLSGATVLLVAAVAVLVARISTPTRASPTSRRRRASRCASSASASTW